MKRAPISQSLRDLEQIAVHDQTTIDIGDLRRLVDRRGRVQWVGEFATPLGYIMICQSRDWPSPGYDHVMAHFIWEGRHYSRGWTEPKRLTRHDLAELVRTFVDVVVHPDTPDDAPTPQRES